MPISAGLQRLCTPNVNHPTPAGRFAGYQHILAIKQRPPFAAALNDEDDRELLE